MSHQFYFTDLDGSNRSFQNPQCGDDCTGCRESFEAYLAVIAARKDVSWDKEALAATPDEWRRELIGAFAIRATEDK